MNLLIVSNMAHYRRADGVIVGHGATARELSVLASLFERVRHVACLHDEPPPASALPYSASNVELVPVPPTGGASISAKLDIVWHTPRYAIEIARHVRWADAVHVRCPANITLVALAVLTSSPWPKRRWIKYAGNWHPEHVDYASYRLQRRWLESGAVRAEVTINGAWPGQPAHVHSWMNPCLTDDELARGALVAGSKRLAGPVHLLFVGHLGAAKNPRIAIDAVALLRRQGIAATLDLAGGGAELAALREHAVRAGVGDSVTFHGPLPRHELDRLYEVAHFVVLPTNTEGWAKALGEGMGYGAVPIATAVGSIPSILASSDVGRALEMPPRAESFAAAIAEYTRDPDRWYRESQRSVIAARAFSFGVYKDAVRDLLALNK